MSSEIGADIAIVNGALRFKRLVTDIPASGILEIPITAAASITLTGGGSLSLYGIKYVDEEGTQIVIDEEFSDAKLFRVAAGVSITVLHNQAVDAAAQAIPVEQRILTSSGKSFALEVINTQTVFAYASAVAGFRWGFTDRNNYNATPGDWDGSPPDTTADAITRLAAAVALLSGPIP
jgi:hypothetical protein